MSNENENVLQWDEKAGIRERLALLAALFGKGSVADKVARASYDPSGDCWTIDLQGSEMGPRKVVIGSEASVQLDRLRKFGVTYHEAMRLIGYPEKTFNENGESQ